MKGGDSSTAQEFLSGKPAAVNVAGIEKRLAQLWREAANGNADAGHGPVVRACSFNLILVTDEDDGETKCGDLLDEIERHHPCRSILAVYRPQREPHNLSAWVSARCHTVGPSKQICSEQVTVCCDNGQPEELASVVLPLVLPDLPVFMWWRQSKIDWRELSALRGCARKFIFDSGRRPSDTQTLQDACKLIQKNGHCLLVCDLNWRRLNPWCCAIADSFDGFPMPPELLDKISRVTIRMGGRPAPYSRALLLCGWLASRLNWLPQRYVAEKQISFKRGGDTVEVVFEIDRDVDGSHFQQIEIEFGSDKRKLLVEPERSEEVRFIIARAADSNENEATRIGNTLSETTLVGQELEVLHGDQLYVAAVQMVSKILSG